jgi:hypothetical protein
MREGALVGLTAAQADPALAPPPFAASAAITTNPMASKYVTYPTTASNTYSHSSLLQPATADTAGQLGTARMQTDAITFLVFNR